MRQQPDLIIREFFTRTVTLKQLTKTKPLLIASLIVTLAAVAMTYPAVQAGLPQARDYNCYIPVNPLSSLNNLEVTLEDQFGVTEHITGDLTEVCASADKFVPPDKFFENPFGDGAHFTCYDIGTEDSAPDILGVILTDQFDSVAHEVGDIVEICGPSTKLANQFPFVANVFWKCYGIDGDPIAQDVTMTDQFGPHTYTTITPVLLCNPATATTFLGTFAPIGFEDLHLKCYTVDGAENFPIGNAFIDQFGSHAVSIADETKICVEVEKTVIDFTVEKFYTHTDVDWEPICEGFVNPEDELCYDNDEFSGDPINFTPVEFDENNFGTLLDPGNSPFEVKAVVHPNNGKVNSYNPGQYYAVTKVTLESPIDAISIWEDFVDCTDRDQSGVKNNNVAAVSIVNPKKAPGGAAIVVVNPNGDVLDLSDELADSGQLFFDDKDSDGVIDIGHAEDVENGTVEALTGVEAEFDTETMIYMYVKFKPGLKGENFITLEPEFKTCENWETVEVLIGEFDPIEKMAHATLNVVPKV